MTHAFILPALASGYMILTALICPKFWKERGKEKNIYELIQISEFRQMN